MPRPNSHLSPLESRKQILLATSELNRAQLLGDVATLFSGLRSLSERIKYIKAAGSAVVFLFAALAVGRRRGTTEPPPKHHWMSLLIRGIGLVSTVWMAGRSDRTAPSPAPR